MGLEYRLKEVLSMARKILDGMRNKIEKIEAEKRASMDSQEWEKLASSVSIGDSLRYTQELPLEDFEEKCANVIGDISKFGDVEKIRKIVNYYQGGAIISPSAELNHPLLSHSCCLAPLSTVTFYRW